LDFGARRPGVHASRQRLVDDFLALNDPGVLRQGWLNSVVYVSALSLWALVSGHWSAWQAARVEVEQQRQLAAQEEHPVEERVVEKMVEHTDVKREVD
jgi:hypothetical protein